MGSSSGPSSGSLSPSARSSALFVGANAGRSTWPPAASPCSPSWPARWSACPSARWPTAAAGSWAAPLWPVGGAVVGAGVGALLGPVGRPPSPEPARRIPDRLRPVIFLAPALLFLAWRSSCRPIRTVYLSFRGRRGEEFVGARELPVDLPATGRSSASTGPGDIFTSRLFLAARGDRRGRRRAWPLVRARSASRGLDLGGAGARSLSLGTAGVLVVLAVVGIAAGRHLEQPLLGRLRHRLQHRARPRDRRPGRPGPRRDRGQVADLHADGDQLRRRQRDLAVRLRLHPARSRPDRAAQRRVGRRPAATRRRGSSSVPWNNLFLIVIMIWIQTGFAMVVLSAAIKGVPVELHRGGAGRRRQRGPDLLAGHAAADPQHDRSSSSRRSSSRC